MKHFQRPVKQAQNDNGGIRKKIYVICFLESQYFAQRLNQPFDDQNFGDISKIDRIESKIDQDFSDFGSEIDFISKYDNNVDENSAIQQFSSGEEPPLLQLTNLLTTKLLNNLGEDVVWPQIKMEEDLDTKKDPIRILKKIRKEKEGVFGKKKNYVRRKHVNHMRDK